MHILAAAAGWDWIIEIGKQIPALIALVWLVYKFLEHLRSERSAREAYAAQVAETMRADREERERSAERREQAIIRLSDSCHAFQERSIARVDALAIRTDAALRENTRSLDINTKAVERFEQTVANAVRRSTEEGGD